MLSSTRGSQALALRVFDEVKVALFVESRPRARKELVYRIVDPPFHALPSPAALRAAGLRIDDRTVTVAQTNTLRVDPRPAAAATDAGSSLSGSGAGALVQQAGLKRGRGAAGGTGV